jgi:hypothetical protein
MRTFYCAGNLPEWKRNIARIQAGGGNLVKQRLKLVIVEPIINITSNPGLL